jgi:DNA (cytosine-5)-methyltransferase 1
LQGFNPDWCGDLETPEPTEEDIDFWMEVFENERLAVGYPTKAKSRNQIIKWLKNPRSDAAEYKLWGNGIALPCAFYVLQGVAGYAARRQPVAG